MVLSARYPLRHAKLTHCSVQLLWCVVQEQRGDVYLLVQYSGWRLQHGSLEGNVEQRLQSGTVRRQLQLIILKEVRNIMILHKIKIKPIN